MQYDFIVVGGGILGLSSSLALRQRFPDARIVLLEKEGELAAHQTGRNSGVIHSGIYYTPGSLKARFAAAGSRSMVKFCRQHDIEHEICGKVIVATEQSELPALRDLYERGLANGLDAQLIGPEALREIEPHARGLQAIRVASTGIVNYRMVAAKLAELFEARGGIVRFNQAAEKIVVRSDGVTVLTQTDVFNGKYMISCAGLQSDRVARRAGARLASKIVPFRGEYYNLKPEKRFLVRGLIYPVPNPAFPFLGVHFTRMIGGEVHSGPNAVLGFKREGYRWADINFRDLAEVLAFPGFLRLAARYWREGAQEMVRSLSKPAFTRSLQRLVPAIEADDLVPTHAGVRAQALRPDGTLVEDFLIVGAGRAWHVCNAPSPAATASLEIGNYIASQVAERVAR